MRTVTVESRINRPRYIVIVSNRTLYRAAMVLLLVAAGGLINLVPVAAQENKVRTFNLDIRSGKVAEENKTIKVNEGDQITLRWTTDEAVKLHLHGYDVHLHVKPNEPKTMNLKAHSTGRFPFTVHGAGGHGKSAMAYLEVHPG